MIDMAQLASRGSEAPKTEQQFEFMLRQKGYSETDVRWALVFVPMALVTDVMQKMGLRYSEEDTYFVVREGSEPESRRLSSEPLYRAAVASIEIILNQFGSDALLRIASLSAEMNAVNSALHSGMSVAELRGSTISPSIVPADMLGRRLGR